MSATNKTRQASTVPSPPLSPASSPSLKAKIPKSEQTNLVNASRNMRRLKRQMFLQAVKEEPKSPTDQFREILLATALRGSFSEAPLITDIPDLSLPPVQEQPDSTDT